MEKKLFCPMTTTECNNVRILQQRGNQMPHDNYRCNLMSNNTNSNSSIGSDLNSSVSDTCILSLQSCQNSTNQKSKPCVGVNLRITGQCSQGGRKYMEDFFTVAYQQLQNSNDLEYAFVGIYDGHGGTEAATFAKEHLMLHIINQKLFWSDIDQDVLRAIREGYIATHYAMWRQQETWPKTGNGLPSTAGTTATVAFIRREKLFIGHVGDSGIVLGYQNDNEDFWRAKQLTVDHKPELLAEHTRILNSGGKVITKSGVPRVVWNRPRNVNHRGPVLRKTPVDEIPFLAVARSLGDLWSYNSEHNEFVVSPDPDVQVIPINPHTFRCLIFGTDGLWNVVSPEDAVNTVRDNELLNKRLKSQYGSTYEDTYCVNPSKILVEQALQNWSAKKMRADNTSVVTIIFYPPGKAECNIINNNDKCHGLTLFKPVSSEIENSETNVEIPVYYDTSGVTYKELAMKHLPPEAYQNYNFYKDDQINSESVELGVDYVSEEHDCNMGVHLWNKNIPINNKTYCELNRNVPLPDYHKCTKREIVEEKYVSNFVGPYNTLLHCKQTQQIPYDIETCNSSWITPNNTNFDNLSDRSELKNSSYFVKMQVMNPTNMQDVMQEQQLYQQQCMNEEDGYLLTKLETRQEQQTIRVQQLNIPSNLKISEDQIAGSFKNYNAALYQQSHIERLSHEQYMTPSQIHHRVKPLEVQSLLQQELEEEKQVAFERQQMQSEVILSGLMNAQQSLHFDRSLKMVTEISKQNFNKNIVDDEEVVNDYLEKEKIVAQNTTNYSDNKVIKEEEELCDATVQINEVSSSTSRKEDSLDNVTNKLMINKGKITNKMDLCNTRRTFKCNVSPRMSLPARNAKSATFVNTRRTNNRSLGRPITGSTNLVKTSVTNVNNYTKSRAHSSSHFYSNLPNENSQNNSSHSSKRNLTNSTTGTSKKYSDSIIVSHSTVQNARHSKSEHINGNSNNQSTYNTKRQLRSNSTNCNNNLSHIGYFKSTLRSRNLLTKDMKCKNSLMTAARMFPNNPSSKHYLKNMGSGLKAAGDSSLRNAAKSITNCKAVKNSLNKGSRIEEASFKLELNNTLVNKRTLEQRPTYAVNLRSRSRPSCYLLSTVNNNTRRREGAASATSQLHTPLSSPTRKVNITVTASVNERRRQHGMHTRSSSKLQTIRINNSPIPLMTGGFSKSTRPQNVNNSLTPPPPSPKLMNAIAAVAAATRARSLLSSKQASTINNAQSVVAAIFGKRSSLRSNSNTSRRSSAVTVTTTPTLSSASQSSYNNKLVMQSSRIIRKLKR